MTVFYYDLHMGKIVKVEVTPYKAVIEGECYVVATTESKLLYLDPHICQPFSDVGRDGSDKSYHSGVTTYMDISELDPSVAVVSCFEYVLVDL